MAGADTLPEPDDNAEERKSSSATSAATVEPQPQPTELPTPNRVVLVLEDDLVQLRLLQQHLESLGLTLLTARSIAEAQQHLSENRPQLAIFDVNLPDGSGLELCEQLDSDPRHCTMPIIVLSSMTGNDMIRKTRASGGCYFVGKPYDPNVLLILIERALGESLQ